MTKNKEGLKPLNKDELENLLKENHNNLTSGDESYPNWDDVAKLICNNFGQPKPIKYPEKIKEELHMRTNCLVGREWNQAINEFRRLNES